MALATGRPVWRSHRIVVSRWLVRPMAARSAAAIRAWPRASRATESCVDQMASGSCSTSPGAGKICGSSRWAEATARPSRPNTMARLDVVPWSRARTYRVMVARIVCPSTEAALGQDRFGPGPGRAVGSGADWWVPPTPLEARRAMSNHSFPSHRGSFALALFLGIGLATAAHAQVMTDPNLTVDTVVASGAGLSQPTTMKFLGPADFLVLEKATGRVRRVVNHVLQPGFALDVNVNSSSERGMLGIAIAFGSPIHVFLYYTEAQGMDGGTPLGNRVYRYDWNPATGTLINPLLVLDLPVLPGPNHDSGVILIHPVTGLLYAQIGDLNHNGQLQHQPNGAAPDDTGVLTRVTQDGTPAAGNPFTPYCSVTTTQTCVTTANCPAGQTCITNVARYYAYGIRNGFGLEFDPANNYAL